MESKIGQLSQEIIDEQKLVPELISKIETELRAFSNTQYSITK